MKLRRLTPLLPLFLSALVISCSESRIQKSGKADDFSSRITAYRQNPSDFGENAAWGLLVESLQRGDLKGTKFRELAQTPGQPQDDRLILVALIESEHRLPPRYLKLLLENALAAQDLEKMRYAWRLLAVRTDRAELMKSVDFEDILNETKKLVAQRKDDVLQLSLKSLREESKLKKAAASGASATSKGARNRNLAAVLLGDRIDTESKETRKDRINQCRNQARRAIRKLEQRAELFDQEYSRYAKSTVELQSSQILNHGSYARLSDEMAMLREDQARQETRNRASRRVVESLQPVMNDLKSLEELEPAAELARQVTQYISTLNEKSLLAEARMLHMISQAESSEKADALRVLLKLLQSMGLSHAVFISDEKMSGEAATRALARDPKFTEEAGASDRVIQQLELIKDLSFRTNQLRQAFVSCLSRLDAIAQEQAAIVKDSEEQLGQVEASIAQLKSDWEGSSVEVAKLQAKIDEELVFMRVAQSKMQDIRTQQIPSWVRRRDKTCLKVK
jgi:hypothetical protein